MPILRRLSARFGHKHEEHGIANGSTLEKVDETKELRDKPHGKQTNGETVTNGTKLGNSLEKTKVVNKRHPSYSAEQHENPASKSGDDKNTAAATRKDVEGAFEQFAQLIHASRRPLPSQSGDGSYLTEEKQSGFWDDIKHMGLKDVEANIKTVRHLLEDKASGKPQDDRKMHMEEIMQVRANCLASRSDTKLITACCFFARQVCTPGGTDIDVSWRALEFASASSFVLFGR